MQIDLEKINKLPPDVRDRFKKILFKLSLGAGYMHQGPLLWVQGSGHLRPVLVSGGPHKVLDQVAWWWLLR